MSCLLENWYKNFRNTVVLYHLLIIGELINYKPYTDNELQNLNWKEKCRLIQIDFTVRHELKEEVSGMALGFQSHDITDWMRLALKGVTTFEDSISLHINYQWLLNILQSQCFFFVNKMLFFEFKCHSIVFWTKLPLKIYSRGWPSLLLRLLLKD